jgi:hypothetical protein
VAWIDKQVEESQEANRAAQSCRSGAACHRVERYSHVQGDVEGHVSENWIKKSSKQDRQYSCREGNREAFNSTPLG